MTTNEQLFKDPGKVYFSDEFRKMRERRKKPRISKSNRHLALERSILDKKYGCSEHRNTRIEDNTGSCG